MSIGISRLHRAGDHACMHRTTFTALCSSTTVIFYDLIILTVLFSNGLVEWLGVIWFLRPLRLKQ